MLCATLQLFSCKKLKEEKAYLLYRMKALRDSIESKNIAFKHSKNDAQYMFLVEALYRIVRATNVKHFDHKKISIHI